MTDLWIRDNKDSENGNAGEYIRGWDNALNAVMQLIRQPRDGKMQEVFPEIAKLIDEHKAEGNERGELCRQMIAIFEAHQ